MRSGELINRLNEILYLEYDRLLLWLPVFFAAGIGVYFSLPSEPPIVFGGIACVLLAGSVMLFWRYFLIRVILLAFFLSAAGFSIASLRSTSLSTPVLLKKLSPRMITGHVTEVRHYNTGKLHIILKNPEFRTRKTEGPEQKLHKIRLKVQKFDQLPYPGDKISVRAGLSPPPPPTMPGDFDYARQIWFQGIGAVGYTISVPEIITENPRRDSLANRQRLTIAEDVRATIPGDAGGLAAALITGMRDGISYDVAENMRNSGLAHLLAISGLHMGLLCGAAFFFSRFLLSRSEYLALHFPLKKWAAIIAIGSGLCLPEWRIGADSSGLHYGRYFILGCSL